jgi:hypothetical protein
MKKEVRQISTLTLFNLDPEVVFHTIDVTLNSSIKRTHFIKWTHVPGPIISRSP